MFFRHLTLFFSVEHPAAGYRKIFETVEELTEPMTAEITGRKEEQAIMSLPYTNMTVYMEITLDPQTTIDSIL